MNNSGKIIWENQPVGSVTNITPDMWYLEADWQPLLSDDSAKFVNIAQKLRSKEVFKDLNKGVVAVLTYDDVPNNPNRVIIIALDNLKIFMRRVTENIPNPTKELMLLLPWQTTDKPTFYETQLRKEVSFFHTLYFKKVRTIGIRVDRDDVLFEVIGGLNKYAVVHLTYRKAFSRKFPLTQFYKNWEDFFNNRLMDDHKDWEK